MPTNVLVSGAPERIEAVAKALREHDCTVVEVDDLERVPQACAEAGEGSFDAYVQMPAAFAIEGGTKAWQAAGLPVHIGPDPGPR